MSSTVSDLNIYKDFEIMWVDKSNHQPKDMDDVTLEIYHYQGPDPAQATVPLKEPYIFTETVNDIVNIGSICVSEAIDIETHITLDLNIINDQLEGLECPPNDFIVPGTTDKVAIVNGYKKYAVSSCELAALINIGASGYVASDEEGFLVLTSEFSGSGCLLQVGNGSFNCVVGLVEGDKYWGTDCEKNIIIGPKSMKRVDTGTYVCCKVPIKVPLFVEGERYYVMYRAIDPISSIEEISQEDFTIIKSNGSSITFSFLK